MFHKDIEERKILLFGHDDKEEDLHNKLFPNHEVNVVVLEGDM